MMGPCRFRAARFADPIFRSNSLLVKLQGKSMHITTAHIGPIVAIIAGILILIMPRLLNYIVALYLIFIGLFELNVIQHFVRWH
jgi:hypothetical protein